MQGLQVGLSYTVALIFALLIAIGFVSITVVYFVHTLLFVYSLNIHTDEREGMLIYIQSVAILCLLYTHACILTFLCSCMHTHMHTHAHAHTHAHTHTHTHTGDTTGSTDGQLHIGKRQPRVSQRSEL